MAGSKSQLDVDVGPHFAHLRKKTLREIAGDAAGVNSSVRSVDQKRMLDRGRRAFDNGGRFTAACRDPPRANRYLR